VLESTLEEVMRLSRISEELLTLARSDARTLTPSLDLVDPEAVATRVLERLRPKASERGVRLELRTPQDLLASLDSGMMSQIIWNLTDNAIRHSPEGASVLVALDTAADRVVITVQDAGPGLGSLDPDSVFERFTRGDLARTSQRDDGGTGLGLAIVKVLALSHGGSARAETLPHGGARFTVELAQNPDAGEGGAA
jgi:signal transduction histidine kinase